MMEAQAEKTTKRAVFVSPSLLAADKSDLFGQMKSCQEAGCRYIHIDIMDGVFVPEVSFGLDFVKSLPRRHAMLYDVHIMIADPFGQAASFAEAGADVVTFHYEACQDDLERCATIERIHRAGAKAGMSIKPQTPAFALVPFLKKLDLVLVMSVEPGKGGQSFMDEALGKISFLRALIGGSAKPLIEVDGGINDVTGPKCVRSGADILVAGSYLFGHEDLAARIGRLLGD